MACSSSDSLGKCGPCIHVPRNCIGRLLHHERFAPRPDAESILLRLEQTFAEPTTAHRRKSGNVRRSWPTTGTARPSSKPTGTGRSEGQRKRRALLYYLNCQKDRLSRQTVYQIKDDPAVQGHSGCLRAVISDAIATRRSWGDRFEHDAAFRQGARLPLCRTQCSASARRTMGAVTTSGAVNS
jgi:hypothetical protein